MRPVDTVSNYMRSLEPASSHTTLKNPVVMKVPRPGYEYQLVSGGMLTTWHALPAKVGTNFVVRFK
jgi:hypothetical protein